MNKKAQGTKNIRYKKMGKGGERSEGVSENVIVKS